MPRTPAVLRGFPPHLVAGVAALVACCLGAPSPTGAQPRERRNFHGMHNLMDGGASIPEGMNWTRHLVGEGGYVFDWVRGDYGKWVVEAMDRGLIPCLRLQECNGGCDPSPGYPETVASVIREHLERYRPQYLNRLVYLQLWNEPGDARDFVTPERFADYLVAAHAGVNRADLHDVFRTMTPGQNGPDWWRRAIRHNPAVCQAFDVWATHPYPESYPPRYNHHDGVPFINQVKTIDSYLLDLDAVADECEKQGSPRRGFPVMITETAYGDHLGIAYEGYPKTTRGPACSTDGPCESDMASEYNVAAFGTFWRSWPEIVAVHPFILNNWAWDHFAFVSRGSGSRADQPKPAWCPPQDIGAGVTWPPGYSAGAQRCGEPTAPYPQFTALLGLPKPPPASLEPYRGPVGNLRGFVRRADTGDPVKYATVFTDGRAFGGPSLSDGQYVVHDVPVGNYTLSVEKLGYGGATTRVTVTEGQETVADFDIPYRGKVSKGIYFQNWGTCSGCDLFASFVGQSFTVPPDVGFVKFAAAMPNVGQVTLRFSILDGGPTGAQVGPSATAYLEWGGEMIGAEWPGDGVPVEPGGVYFLKVERTDGSGVYLYATDANPYPGGMVYTGTTPRPGWDLFSTIRGLTVAVDTAVGTLAGVVEDTTGQALAGARVTVEPGAHTTVSAADGRYLLGALAEGLYTVSASLAGFLPQARSGVEILSGQTTLVDLVLERDVSRGRLAGQVRDEQGAPIAGAGIVVTPGGHGTTTDAAGVYAFDSLAPGSYTVSVSRDGFASRDAAAVVEGGATTTLDVVLSALPPPPAPGTLIVNGDFSQGLSGWTLWRERGSLSPVVTGSGQLQLAAIGHNGGVYQRFSTGGAGRTITIDGVWASSPTRAQSQWAEVLVINGPATPVEGQDVNASQPNVVLIYKNDTWKSPGGWSGEMRQTSPVAAAGSFVSAGDVATVVLKSGNLLGVSSGTLFDDVVVRGPDAPPANRPPTARATAAPVSGIAPLAVTFDGSGSSDPDGDVLGHAWTFGDGATGTGAIVSHTYASAGSFTVTLTVDDGRGGTDTATLVVTATSPEPPPTGVEWDARLSSLGVQLVSADPAPGTWYWKLTEARFESDGEILPPPGGGSESGGTHSIYVRALGADGQPLENQEATALWPNPNPTSQASVRTKGAVDGFWGDFAMAGGSWCPFYPEGPRGPYGMRMAGVASETVWGMGLPCNRHVSFRLVWRWTQRPTVSPGSKLTIHTGFGGPLSMQFVQTARPGLIKILDSFSGAAEVKRLSPKTEIIGRAYLASQVMDGDPVQRAREWWDRARSLVLQNPDVDYWEGYNEPIIQTPELMAWYAEFETERVRLLATEGRKACIGNFSVGNPDLPLWPAFFPAIDAALAHDGILGLHEYGTPMQQYFDTTTGEGWLCGRYRKVYRQYLLATGRPIRLAITECGVDVVPPVGWKNHFTGEEYLEQLKWYDGILREDDYVIGATIFALEIPGWWSFDIAPIVGRLADYVAAEAPAP